MTDTTPEARAALCERLEQYEGQSFETTACYNGLRDEAAAMIRALGGALCDDCPPMGYPTDKTRCLSCPRRSDLLPEQADPLGAATFPEFREDDE